MAGAGTRVPAALVERLAILGLDARQAKLYLHLHASGPCRARDATAALRLERAETYRAIHALMRRGLVTARLERPTLYEALAPEKLFEDALAKHELRRVELEKTREDLLDILEDLRRQRSGDVITPSYKIVTGRRPILELAEALVRRGEQQRMVSTYFAPENATASNQAFQATIRRAEEGMRMRLLVRRDPEWADKLRPLTRHPHVEVRYFDHPETLRFSVIDERELLSWMVTDPSPSLGARGDVALWTDAPDFVASHRALYDLLWERAG